MILSQPAPCGNLAWHRVLDSCATLRGPKVRRLQDSFVAIAFLGDFGLSGGHFRCVSGLHLRPRYVVCHVDPLPRTLVSISERSIYAFEMINAKRVLLRA